MDGREIMALPPVQTAGPQNPAVDLADMRQHARIDDAAEDALVQAYVASAAALVEKQSGRKLITQSWRQAFSGFADRLWLSLSPVQSITIVEYYDTANALQTLSSSLYRLQDGGGGAYVERDSDATYPDTYTRDDAVRVTVVAGYGDDSSALPPTLLQAVRLIAGLWSEEREDAVPAELRAIPMGATALIAVERRGWF